VDLPEPTRPSGPTPCRSQVPGPDHHRDGNPCVYRRLLTLSANAVSMSQAGSKVMFTTWA
jgi:hypothetical protein